MEQKDQRTLNFEIKSNNPSLAKAMSIDLQNTIRSEGVAHIKSKS